MQWLALQPERLHMIERFTAQTTTESASIQTLLFVIILSFMLSTLLAYVYRKTYRGLSYSRNYVQAIVLISIIAAMVIQSIGDSLSHAWNNGGDGDYSVSYQL
jgi:hypothetical protein